MHEGGRVSSTPGAGGTPAERVRRPLAEVEASTARLLDTLSGLTDADQRAPSGLPGWTRGHVCAHVARNADSYSRLLDWARTGRRIAQSPSRAARAEEIESGAGAPAARCWPRRGPRRTGSPSGYARC